MDPFSSSPAQPHSVMSSLFGGGQTPASALAHGFGGQTPASALAHGFGGQTPASALAHGFGGQTPASGLGGHGFGGPGSVFFNHGSLLSGAGPGSILGGPGSILNSSNGPNSIGPNSSILSGFDRAGIEGLNSVHYSEPGSVLNNNLAVPMTPLAGGESSVQNNMPASNIPMMMPATPMTNINAVDVPSPTLQNIVSTVNLGVQLDLKQIALRARNAEYNPKRFAAVIMRIREPRTTALIFSSGKMVCTGAKSEETSRLAARKYARIVQKWASTPSSQSSKCKIWWDLVT
uniref:Uncharacterized protein n=1 Tax=Ditylenchus dipsaci TaxID=166011 RepID=A0A915D4P7_9BILA